MYSAHDLFANYAGRARELQGWTADATINRDRNLRLQYLAGSSMNLHDGDRHLPRHPPLSHIPGRSLRRVVHDALGSSTGDRRGARMTRLVAWCTLILASRRVRELCAQTFRSTQEVERPAVRARRAHDGLGAEAHRLECGRDERPETVRRRVRRIRSPRSSHECLEGGQRHPQAERRRRRSPGASEPRDIRGVTDRPRRQRVDGGTIRRHVRSADRCVEVRSGSG